MKGERPKGDRPKRLAEAIRGELSMMLATEVKDPRVHAAGIMTVTNVRLSDDLGLARVNVSFVGGDADEIKGALEGLARAAGFLRGELARRLALKRAPQLKFEHDTTADHVARIDALLREDGGK